MSTLKKRSYAGLQADLAAANREVQQVMQENSALKADQHHEALAIEANYAKSAAELAQIASHLARIASNFSNRLAQLIDNRRH